MPADGDAAFCAQAGELLAGPRGADEILAGLPADPGHRVSARLRPPAATVAGPARPQQMHLDVMVDDVAAAEPRVQALGARWLPGGDSRSPAYAVPAGHPFCLIPRPGWAAPIGDTPGG